MNNFLSKLLFLALLTGTVIGVYSMYQSVSERVETSMDKVSFISYEAETLPDQPIHQGELIQIALLLDVSGSMEGLINQARAELWKVVNDLSGRNETNSRLEIALYAYGYGGEPIIRRLSDFTTDLDHVSQLLYSLNTSGSVEWCGTVIRDAVTDLSWRKASKGGRFICIAGNEPFTQGPFSYEKACNMAHEQGIVVNTIFCGEEHVGLMSGWKDGAEVGGGAFFAINHNHQVRDIASPWDDEISSVNEKLNTTYINYSHQGVDKKMNQTRQDANALNYNGRANVATRAKSKLSGYYSNSSWDLVDAVEEEKVSLDTITVGAAYLAPELQEKTKEELIEEVERLKTNRSQFKAELSSLIARRDSFVAAERAKEMNAPTSLGEALSKSFKEKLNK
jgi:hypothetical protein